MGSAEVGVGGGAVAGIDDVDVLGKAVTLDLPGVNFLARPADDARDRSRLAAGFSGGEQFPEPLFLKVPDAVRVRAPLLQVFGNDEGRASLRPSSLPPQ